MSRRWREGGRVKRRWREGVRVSEQEVERGSEGE